jgi:hypothetical protein
MALTTFAAPVERVHFQHHRRRDGQTTAHPPPLVDTAPHGSAHLAPSSPPTPPAPRRIADD